MSYDILLFDADRTLFDFDASEKLAFFIGYDDDDTPVVEARYSCCDADHNYDPLATFYDVGLDEDEWTYTLYVDGENGVALNKDADFDAIIDDLAAWADENDKLPL